MPECQTQLTDGCVPHERLLVLQHRVDGELLAVLRRHNRNCRLLVGRNRRHLFDHFDFGVLVMDARVRIELHRLDDAALLQRQHHLQDVLLGPAAIAARGISDCIRIGMTLCFIFIFTVQSLRV